MKRQYTPYWEWEDWLNGMWRKETPSNETIFLRKAIIFTGNHQKYGCAMRKVVKAWPKTMINHLTNTSINRRAFLGHCACCFEFNCPEYITRKAWHSLTETQRILADNEAQKIIDSYILNYEAENKCIHTNLGEKLLP